MCKVQCALEDKNNMDKIVCTTNTIFIPRITAAQGSIVYQTSMFQSGFHMDDDRCQVGQ